MGCHCSRERFQGCRHQKEGHNVQLRVVGTEKLGSTSSAFEGKQKGGQRKRADEVRGDNALFPRM